MWRNDFIQHKSSTFLQSLFVVAMGLKFGDLLTHFKGFTLDTEVPLFAKTVVMHSR